MMTDAYLLWQSKHSIECMAPEWVGPVRALWDLAWTRQCLEEKRTKNTKEWAIARSLAGLLLLQSTYWRETWPSSIQPRYPRWGSDQRGCWYSLHRNEHHRRPNNPKSTICRTGWRGQRSLSQEERWETNKKERRIHKLSWWMVNDTTTMEENQQSYNNDLLEKIKACLLFWEKSFSNFPFFGSSEGANAKFSQMMSKLL